VSRCGWFSECSAAYLASGRPVIVQDTGFSTWLHADRGVLPFHDGPSAETAIASLAADYIGHCAAARGIAEEYFDSDRVLTRLLRDIEESA
jgi:hypothetical protein